MKFRKAVAAAATFAVLATSAMSASAHQIGTHGGDIVVLDILDEAVGASRPAGGGEEGGGGDIIVFDIVYASDNASRPAGGGGDGGGGDIILWDIVHSAADASRPAGGGGGIDITVWDIVDS